MKSLTRVSLCVLFSICSSASVGASLFVSFESTGITWSNTGLSAGPPQPVGYVEVPDLGPAFTGDIPAQDFISLSDVSYGTVSPLSWDQSHLLSSSKVSFDNGALVDVNIAFDNAGTLLTLSGPPTANWAIANSPQPPAVDFPGFPSFGAGFARGDLDLTLLTDMPVIDPVVPNIPPPSPPSYPAEVQAEISDGFIEFDPGGVAFVGEHAHLNAEGPFEIIAGFKQKAIFNNEIDPATDRLWFTNVDVNHEGEVTIGGMTIPFSDPDFDPDDNGFWILNGEAFSVNDLHTVFDANLSALCTTIINAGIGVCEVVGDFDDANIVVGLRANGLLGLEDVLAIDGIGIPEDAFDVSASTSFSSEFDGLLTYRALTVPVNETIVPEPDGLPCYVPLIVLACGRAIGRRRSCGASG